MEAASHSALAMLLVEVFCSMESFANPSFYRNHYQIFALYQISLASKPELLDLLLLFDACSGRLDRVDL